MCVCAARLHPPSPLTMTLMHVSGKRGVDSAHFYPMIYKHCRGVVLLVQEFFLVKF